MKVPFVQFALWSVGLALQYLALTAMVRGKWRTYPLALVYVVLLMATTISDIAAYFVIDDRDAWSRYYWSAELIRQSAMFAVVVSLAVRSLPQGRSRRALTRIALAFAMLFYGSSVALEYNPQVNVWMTTVVRNLSFASAVANLGLWFYLINGDRRDLTTLMLAGGLGLQMTGEAVGQSIRHLLPDQWFVGNMVIVTSHFLCMLIWWQALQRRDSGGACGVPVQTAYRSF